MLSASAEAALYHDPSRYGFFYLIEENTQHSYRLGDLAGVLDHIPKQQDTYIGQAEFFRPNRRLVNLERLPLLFADLETHKTRYHDLKPEQQARMLLWHCEEHSLPRPSLINSSGRGLHVKWPLSQPLPACALPRWRAVQKALGDGFQTWGVDAVARSGSQCLRMVGSINSRSGLEARTIWMDQRGRNGSPALWDFDLLAAEVLPYTREELQERRQARQVTKVQAKTEGRRKSNLWSAQELWWHRLSDVRKLITLRGWQDGVEEGLRNNFLFVAACAVAWGAEAADLEVEVATLAQEFCPTLPVAAVRSTTASIIAKARMSEPYRLTNQTLIEMLDIQAHEQCHLRTICDPDERMRRHRTACRERNRKTCDRAAYEAAAQERRDRARELRAAGLSYQQVAEQMGLTPKQVSNLMSR